MGSEVILDRMPPYLYYIKPACQLIMTSGVPSIHPSGAQKRLRMSGVVVRYSHLLGDGGHSLRSGDDFFFVVVVFLQGVK